MKEERIEVDSDICEYCHYKYLYDKAFQARMCNNCDINYIAYSKKHSNFRGIECIKLTDEKEKNIHLEELIEGVTNIVLNKKTEESIEETIIELLKLSKEELIAFIIKNKISEGIKEYVAMRAEINVEKEEE